MMSRKLPIGIQSLEDLRSNNYLYVDKTEYIWDLVNSGKAYFLSRPRQFEKSLLVSTMEAYFLGKKELFKGLAIEKHENEKEENAWMEYPVIRFSLAGGEYNAENGLSDVLDGVIRETVERYQLKEKYAISGETLPRRFKGLLHKLYARTGRQAVVLIDEYDKPLLDNIETDREQEEKNRELYGGFFGVLKG